MEMRSEEWWRLMKRISEVLLDSGSTPTAQLAALTRMMKDRPNIDCDIELAWGTVRLKALRK